jgi:hypothetical protein
MNLEPGKKTRDGEGLQLAAATQYLLVGMVQGLALWALYEANKRNTWPATDPAVFSAFVHILVDGPIAWYFLSGSLVGGRRRLAWALGVALLIAGLALHAVTSGTDDSRAAPFSFTIASAVLAYVLVALVGGFDASVRRFSYAKLFELSWRNVLVGFVAAALTGILWLLLWAAALMMSAIGIDAVSTFLKQPGTILVVSASAFALGTSQALSRAEALVALRRFWLTLNAWFLPLALILALIWLVSVCVTGTAPLFGTKHAALYLFWFAALAIVFMNAAFQDGSAGLYPRKLANSVRWAWLSVPVLMVIGLWALGLRVQQHGWTVDRVWAAFVGSMGTVYALGYSRGPFARKGWMAAVAPTNILAALLLCSGITMLVSPIADARKIAVADQVRRLLDGRTPPEKFDFQFLRWSGGRYGTDALRRLAEEQAGSPAVRELASAALRSDGRAAMNRQDGSKALPILRSKLLVLPEGAQADSRLLEWLARPYPDYNERECISDVAHCALWIVDLNRAGQAQAVLLWEQHSSVIATLYELEPNGWRRQGTLAGPPLPLSGWLEAIRSGHAVPVKPAWPDIQIGSQRYTVR